VGLAPNSSLFTIIALLIPFLFALLFKDFKYFQKPNVVLYSLLGLFILMAIVYFLLRDRYTAIKQSYEFSNFGVIILMYFTVPFIDKKAIGTNFIKLGLVLSVFGAALLVYAIANDPFYVLGQRAAVRFGTDESAGSNPHIFGKSGYFGAVYAIMALKYKKEVKWGILVPTIVLLLSFFEVIITQTMLAIISFFLMVGVFTFYNFSFGAIASGAKSLFTKWYVLLLFAIGIGKGVQAYQNNPDLVDPFVEMVNVRFMKLANTFIGDKKDSKKYVDESAKGRVEIAKLVFESWDEDVKQGRLRYLIFGHGFKNKYTDIPHLEIFDSFGLLGCLFYSIIFVYMLIRVKVAIKYSNNIIHEFLAYGFIYYAVINFTGGYVVEYARITYYFVFAFFLQHSYPSLKKYAKDQQADKISSNV
jgi:hypothetical protein